METDVRRLWKKEKRRVGLMLPRSVRACLCCWCLQRKGLVASESDLQYGDTIVTQVRQDGTL